jgi:hypothetical protein
VTDQVIADILAIKLQQDAATESAIRQKAERAHAQEELKKIVAQRWLQLVDSATALNTALKPGRIEINVEDGQVAAPLLDFMHIRVARDGQEAGCVALNIDKAGGARFIATIRGARRHEPWERIIAAEHVSLETINRTVLDFVQIVIQKAGR